ncbi:unannotated protein [freshwater metagenome]|uniref:Unannotated protein n=1 Tax=freshwater metagenome TaxID=449393 RepID=A0A6J7DIT3_9ZZZZ
MRKQGVILEDGVDIAVKGRVFRDIFSEQLNGSRGRRLESGNHTEDSSFPRSGRPKHGKELTWGDVEIDSADSVDRTE